MELRIRGLKEIITAFDKAGVALPGEFQRAMTASTIEVRQSAQNKAPVKTGALRQSITEVVDPHPLIGRISVGQPYGKDVEFGTKAHVIEPSNKKALAFKINGSLVIARRVNHPGTKAKPFMRPALKDNIQKITRYFQQATDKVLADITRT